MELIALDWIVLAVLIIISVTIFITLVRKK